MKTSLTQYLDLFAKLRLGTSRLGKAPHKPIFLLTLFELVERGLVQNNRFLVEADLLTLFKENFKLLSPQGFEADLSQPFFHLQELKNPSLGFWWVKLKTGEYLSSRISSLNALNQAVDYGHLNQDLFDLLLSKTELETLKTSILKQYFPQKIQAFQQAKALGGGYAQVVQERVKQEILNEQIIDYQSPMESLLVEAEEEVFVRGSMFRKLIPQIYGHTCAMTGFKFITDDGTSLLDACHIIPFNKSRDDRISNGLALCPNLHRAFDRGWVGVDENFKILVSDCFVELPHHAYALGHLRGRPLILPFGVKHRPSLEHLTWHRNHVFRS